MEPIGFVASHGSGIPTSYQTQSNTDTVQRFSVNANIKHKARISTIMTIAKMSPKNVNGVLLSTAGPVDLGDVMISDDTVFSGDDLEYGSNNAARGAAESNVLLNKSSDVATDEKKTSKANKVSKAITGKTKVADVLEDEEEDEDEEDDIAIAASKVSKTSRKSRKSKKSKKSVSAAKKTKADPNATTEKSARAKKSAKPNILDTEEESDASSEAGIDAMDDGSSESNEPIVALVSDNKKPKKAGRVSILVTDDEAPEPETKKKLVLVPSASAPTVISPSSTKAAMGMRDRRPGLMNVLILHTGGTLGMDPTKSFDESKKLLPGTGGVYQEAHGLRPGYLADLLEVVPELEFSANIDLQVLFNLDSSNVGPNEWIKIAKVLDKNRRFYDAFVVVHGTDTMAYTASALSLLLAGFGKPIVMTGSQLPLLSPRTDARQNLVDSITCATAGKLHEVAICFGGILLRGNRSQKASTSLYRAFASPSYPHLATLGVDVIWNDQALLPKPVAYRARFKLEPRVIRVPIIPGCDPRISYGDLAERGVKGVVVEAFGTGNMPDKSQFGWLPWLRQMTKAGVYVYLGSQCQTGALAPELYKSGSTALKYGAYSANQMTPECAVVKLMLCLAHPDLKVNYPFSGEL